MKRYVSKIANKTSPSYQMGARYMEHVVKNDIVTDKVIFYRSKRDADAGNAMMVRQSTNTLRNFKVNPSRKAKRPRTPTLAEMRKAYGSPRKAAKRKTAKRIAYVKPTTKRRYLRTYMVDKGMSANGPWFNVAVFTKPDEAKAYCRAYAKTQPAGMFFRVLANK